MPQPLPYLSWLEDDPQQVMQVKTSYRPLIKGWKWNYGPALKQKGWTGVWQNFARLYAYWLVLVPKAQGGYSDLFQNASPTQLMESARNAFYQTLQQHGGWQMKRRADVAYMPQFIAWLQTVGKPVDHQFYDWYPATLQTDPNNWRAAMGNPRKLPASSFYLVNGKRYFSNQSQPDGPFIMSIHTRGYKNAQMNFIAAPTRRKTKQVLTEYAKYKYPPLVWKSILPYHCTLGQNQYGRQIFQFQQGDPKLSYPAWQQQLARNQTLNPARVYWNELKIGPDFPPLFLSIEPQDLGVSGSIYRGTLVPSINYCNDTELPLKYK